MRKAERSWVPGRPRPSGELLMQGHIQLCYVEFLAAAAQAELRSWQAVPALQACAGSGLSYD